MELSGPIALVVVVLLLAANGFFVATEFAVVAARRSRLEQLEAEGHGSARAARDLVNHLDAYIAACQLGITMASLAIGWLGEPAFAHLIEPPLERLIGAFAPAAAHIVAVTVAFALITVLHSVLGEQVPKMLALQVPEGTTMWVARPMQLFYFLFRWPTTGLARLTNGVLRVVGLEPGGGHEHVHSVEELRMLVTGMQQAGVVEESEARVAMRAFQFADLSAGALMTPRTELEAVPATMGLPELLERARTGLHSRFVVYEDTLDNVLGVLYARDLLTVLDRAGQPFDLRTIVRPVLAVPATKAADDLLEEMRAARRHVAVVVDEYGGTAGVVTLSNLLAGLVGRIEEEPPVGAAPATAAESRPEPNGERVLDGLTRLDELEELTGTRLSEEDHEAADTVGGLAMARLGRIPMVGDEVAVDERWRLRVEEKDGRRVARVRLVPAGSSSRGS
jgi:putative hemolysin